MSSFPPLANPVSPPEVFVAPACVHPDRARETVERAVRRGWLRPADAAEAADIDAPELSYVPFWRVSVSIDGFHFGINTIVGGRGRMIPIPTGGARHLDAELMICARTVVPYQPRVPVMFDPIRPLEVGLAELVPVADAKDALAAGSVVEADVEREKAERIAAQIMQRAVQPRDAIYAKYTPEIRAATFCLYPLYYVRYRYTGEANPGGAGGFFVMVSGRTGVLVAAKHPSGARALVGKVRRLFRKAS